MDVILGATELERDRLARYMGPDWVGVREAARDRAGEESRLLIACFERRYTTEILDTNKKYV